MRIKYLACFAVLLACACPPAGAASSYDEATAIGKADSLDPQYRAWYVQIMRPAFSLVFQSLLNQCVPQVPREDVQGFGVVLVIGADGKAKQFFWKSQNAFSSCLEPGLREAAFPPAPKEKFYFGLETSPGPRT